MSIFKKLSDYLFRLQILLNKAKVAEYTKYLLITLRSNHKVRDSIFLFVFAVKHDWWASFNYSFIHSTKICWASTNVSSCWAHAFLPGLALIGLRGHTAVNSLWKHQECITLGKLNRNIATRDQGTHVAWSEGRAQQDIPKTRKRKEYTYKDGRQTFLMGLSR